MELQKDFAELCSLFNAKGVEFPIVGGYAVAFHGAPRFTGDLDIRSAACFRRSTSSAFRLTKLSRRTCCNTSASFNWAECLFKCT
jgi:hypothetical protein